jgi:type IV secretory pathway VirB4 component
MATQAEWSHVRVDGAFHRTYRMANWPQLPVGSDWLNVLLTGTTAVRTVTVVLEPVPMGRAARAADREVMSREADADMKTQKGFRVNARERKRLADVEARERELSEGHAEFQFVGIVTVTAPDLDALDDACADVEQAAAQSFLDLRPLDARHDVAWLASLPLGRVLTRSMS